jgi:flagellar FliL protein
MKTKEPSPPPEAAKGGGKTKLLVLAVPALLALIGAALWFGGVLPPWLGVGAGRQALAANARDGKPGQAGESPAKDATTPQTVMPRPPVFLDLPEIVANLNAGPRRTSFIKLHAKLELAKAEDQPVVAASMPRLLDLFQTYLRDMRPEELRGAEGTYRLREELIARADIAASPARVVNVLFTDMLVQ